MPLPLSLDQHYGVLPEAYWPPEYFTASPDYLRYQIDQFQTLSGKDGRHHPLRALDVGTGIGKGMIALAAAGYETHGLEPSATFRQCAVERMGIDPTRLQLGAVEDATYPDGFFDFINLHAVLEHLFDPSAVLGRVTGWLRPGGLIHVEVPSSDWMMSRLARLFYRLTGGDYVLNLSPMHSPYHLYEFTPRAFELNGRRNGYQLVHHHYWVCECYMPRPVKPLFTSVMSVTRTGMQLAAWLGKATPDRAG